MEELTFTLMDLFLLVPPLIIIEGFFSGSEIAILAADRAKLYQDAKRGSIGAKVAVRLARNQELILSTTMLMTSACVVTSSTLVAIYVRQTFGEDSQLLAILIASPLVVVFGELIPKAVYQNYADKIAPVVSRPVLGTFYLFFPLTKVIAYFNTRVSKLVGPVETLVTGKRQTTREQLKTALEFPQKDSEIRTSEKRMIKRILKFSESKASDALLPLVDVDAIEDSSTLSEALERFRSDRHSRMPVFSERVDNIVGILEISDLFGVEDLAKPVRALMTPAEYVAETQSLQDVLSELRESKTDMVVVVDEHGGAVGILTSEDIIEEVVGEIQDEYDSESLPYKSISPTSWLVQAKTEIELLNDQLKLELPAGDYETLSGFMLQQFGRIPEARDELFFETPAGSLKFIVRSASDRRIELVMIEKLS